MNNNNNNNTNTNTTDQLHLMVRLIDTLFQSVGFGLPAETVWGMGEILVQPRRSPAEEEALDYELRSWCDTTGFCRKDYEAFIKGLSSLRDLKGPERRRVRTLVRHLKAQALVCEEG
ncbi:MAG TPA: hypothetical protein V6D20_24695 [Candidatus Obscuribacterales bacterium]